MQPCDRLTAKEIQVAMLVWEGQTNREIATVVGTTEQVIKNYLRNTFDKLGVWSRLELALYVAAHGGSHWRNPAILPANPESVVEMAHSGAHTGQPTHTQIDEYDQPSPPLSHKARVPSRLISA